MSTQEASDSQAFYNFLSAILSNGGVERPPEELVQEWRSQQGEFGETVEGLRAVLADMEAGDSGKPLCEVADEIREKHNFASSSDP